MTQDAAVQAESAPQITPESVGAIVAAAAQANGTREIPRFVGMEPNKPFMVDDEQFEVAGTVPADLFAALADTVEKMTGEEASTNIIEQYRILKDVMELILTAESWTRFSERLGSRERPIGVQQLIRIAMGLLGEVFGKVPTQLPPPSTSSPETAGESSTDGAPVEESPEQTSTGTGT